MVNKIGKFLPILFLKLIFKKINVNIKHIAQVKVHKKPDGFIVLNSA